MSGRILITTRSFRKLDDPHKQVLSDAGYEIVNSPYSRPATAEEMTDLLADVDGAILGVDHVNAASLARADRLKVISRYGIGVDAVDIAAATERGIVVTNTPGANSVAVAELALGLMLALARHIPAQDKRTRAGEFSPVPGVELAGQTLGLLGLGRIGREVVQRAAAFGMTIQFYDPYPPADDFAERYSLRAVSLHDLIASSDFISLHLPLTEQTHNLIDRDAIASMRHGAILINTARGGLIDEDALYEALSENKLAGAGFDAFASEPPAGSPLLTLDNFIATPHTGSSTRQTTLKMGLMASQNALAVLRGDRPEHVVNPEVYES